MGNGSPRVSQGVTLCGKWACFVRTVAHNNSLMAYILPRHFNAVIIKAHGVCDKLHALIKTAVPFDVKIGAVGVCNIKQLFSIAVYLTSTVKLKLYAHVQIRISVKDRVRLVAVAVDMASASALIAAAAVGVVIVIKVAGIIIVYKTAAVIADCVMIFTAVRAERDIVISRIIVTPYPVTAAVAFSRVFIVTVSAKQLTVHFIDIILVY